MTSRSRVRLGPFARIGASLTLAVGLMVTASACTSQASSIAAEVNAIYDQSADRGAGAAAPQRTHDTAILEWAIESGLLEASFSWESITGTQGAQAGAASGPRNAGPWAAYQDFIEQQAQALKEQIRDGLTLDDVRAYYEEHPERFEVQDELSIEVTEWEGGRAAPPYSFDVTAANVRTLQEEDDLLISAALGLEQGEEATVDRGGGRFAQVRCVTRTDAGVTPFNDVVQAASAQHAADIFSAELDSRIALLSK